MTKINIEDKIVACAKTLERRAKAIDECFGGECSDLTIYIRIPMDGSLPEIEVDGSNYSREYMDILMKGNSQNVRSD